MRLRSSIKMRINEGINERDISIRFVKETIEKILIHKRIVSKNSCHVLSIYLNPTSSHSKTIPAQSDRPSNVSKNECRIGSEK